MLGWIIEKLAQKPSHDWPAPRDVAPRWPEMEARIQADPDDPEALSLYADFLIREGDGRGTALAAFLKATETSDEGLMMDVTKWQLAHTRALRRVLRARHGGSIDAYRFRGGLLDHYGALFTRGEPRAPLLHDAEAFALRNVHLASLAQDIDAYLNDLATRPAACAVRSLSIPGTRVAWAPLFFRNIEHLQVWRFDGLHAPDLRALECLDFGKLHAPKLELLKTRIDNPWHQARDLRLRVLHLEQRGVGQHLFEVLACGALDTVEHLIVPRESHADLGDLSELPALKLLAVAWGLPPLEIDPKVRAACERRGVTLVAPEGLRDQGKTDKASIDPFDVWMERSLIRRIRGTG